MNVILKGLPINLSRDPLDPSEDIRRFSKMDQMGKIVLMGSSRKAHVDLRDVEPQFRCNEEVDAEIHFFCSLSRRIENSIA